MAKIAYTEDIERLALAFVKRDYSEISNHIKQNKQALSYYLEQDGELYGYEIRENIPLSNLYGFRVRLVEFSFSGIDVLYNTTEENILKKLFNTLDTVIKNERAYYIFRVPTQIMGVLMQFNVFFKEAFFCGGIVTYISTNGIMQDETNAKTDVFIATDSYITENKSELLDISAKTFKMYRGQYHISPITADKAGMIYDDWLERSFSSSNEKIFVASYRGRPVGFCTARETRNLVEAVLGGVSNEYREIGAYKNIIRHVVNYAYDTEKLFVIGTQFENLVVQGTWSKFGLKPFNSFYNFHLDAR